MKFYHLTGKILNVGDVIVPGNWGRVIMEIGPSHTAWTYEIHLEHIRLLEFPSKPCRLKSTFAFLTVEAMQYWRNLERQADNVFEVEVLDQSACFHRGDMLGVQSIQGIDKTPEAAAKRYWSQSSPLFLTPSPNSIVIEELVTESALKVLGPLL
jgi:hypothetical protein